MLDRFKLEARSIDGFENLYKIIAGFTADELERNAKSLAELQSIFLKLDVNSYLKIENILGDGFWSYVFLVKQYDCEAGQPQVSTKVLKIVKPYHADPVRWTLHQLARIIQNTNERFLDEAKISSDYFGEGKVRQVKINNEIITAILMPYQGPVSLSKIMRNDIFLTHVPLREWFKFIVRLIQEVQRFHHDAMRVHNDLKPANIIVQMEAAEKSLIKFLKAIPIDLGEAVPFNQRSFFGDLRYVPVLLSFIGIFLKIKDARVDTFALAGTFLELLSKLEKLNNTPEDAVFIVQCRKIFQRMHRQFSPITLEEALLQLNQYNVESVFDNTGEDEKFTAALESLQVKLQNKSRLFAPVLDDRNTFWNTLGRKHSVPIEHSLIAIDKILKLLSNVPVTFDAKDYKAFTDGKLGKLITNFRLQGILPKAFEDLDIRLSKQSVEIQANLVSR